ncbi:flagellar motor switch protein FliM [Desulfobotulus sp.]|jgi:flagellar motor switch protein FliM|uniref:flagellar motor switch protein FliM n=1 Tax=Desulfobotulus sp. TaxID=1940337 RepID=UPI002A3626D2|nr:flagellar motor switch protein FliM [Desulfobotulus sp.]MDY0164033.1 flagellar motor switch protein FliM [Desulfobotulus sp.]
MSEILTQEEVDSLLEGLSSGKVEAEKDAPVDAEGIGQYDFSSQDKVIRGRMPTFEVINERFAREVRSSLSMLLHTNVDISSESLDTLKFSEFGRSLPVPTSLHVFRMDPLRGHALLVLESQLVFNLIDTFFGGKGTGKAKVEGREFTTIEEVMIRKVVLSCLEDLKNSWAPVEPIQTTLVRSEVNPQFATIVLPTDLVIVTRFEVELEQSAGKLVLCQPYAMIEPLRHKLASGFQAETEDVDYTWQRRLKEIIVESDVVVSVELGRAEITGEQLITMKPGDVIPLDQDAEHPLTAYIEGIAKMKGFAGVQRGFQAFRVTEKLTLLQ